MTALPNDYDANPARARLPCHSRVGDTHEVVSARIAAERRGPVLDLACGRGRLAGLLPDPAGWIGLDQSPSQLDHAPAPKLRGDGGALPFADGAFDVVAALWCLYHFDDPARPLAEARRVLRDGGLFVTCTTARDDSPEVCVACPPTTFDAEDAVDIAGSVFGHDALEVVRWDAPYAHLADDRAVEEYVEGHLIPPALRRPVLPPLDVTKRGVLVWAEKRET